MADLNKVMIIGNLTADPEVRTSISNADNKCTVLRLAVNRQTHSGKETTFLDVTCWGRTGEVAAQYLHKGRPVFIEGRLKMDTWQDRQTGKQRSKISIIAENLQLLGGGTPTQQGNGYQQGNYNNEMSDDDIAF